MLWQLVLREIMLLYIMLALDRFHQRERRIENQGRLARGVRVLRRITDSDRTGVFAESAANTDDREIDRQQKNDRLADVIQFLVLRPSHRTIDAPCAGHQKRDHRQTENHHIPIVDQAVSHHAP